MHAHVHDFSSKALTDVLCSDLQGAHEEAEKQAYTRGADCTSLT